MMRKHLLAVAVSGAAAVALAVPVADAAPSQSRTATANVAVKRLDNSSAEHDRIVAYWTPQRMRNAVPGEQLVAGRDKSSATSGTVMRASVKPQARPGPGGSGFTGGYYSGGGKVVTTTGKVFFTLSGVNYVCSGSSAASGNESVVLTAGHCLNEGPGAFASNFAFVPAYDDGARPYGTFTASELLTTTQWAGSGDFNHDVGFAVVSPVDGVSLHDTVGSQAIAFNQPRGQVMHSFGYPQASPYDGSDIAWCWGTVIQDTFGGSTDQGLNCNMTGGSSGGPWFVGFDTGTGVGTLNSVNSFKYRGGQFKNYMWGPYLGTVEQGVFNQAAN